MINVSATFGCRCLIMWTQPAHLDQCAATRDLTADIRLSPPNAKGNCGDDLSVLQSSLNPQKCFSCTSTRGHHDGQRVFGAYSAEPEIRPGCSTHQQQKPTCLGVLKQRNALEPEILLCRLVLQLLARKIGRSNGHTKNHHTLLCSRQLGVTPPNNGLGFDQSGQSGKLLNTWWCGLGTLSSKFEKKTHPKTLSSKNTFIQKRFHPMTLSSKNTFIQKHFHPKTLSSKTADNFIHDTFVQKRFHPIPTP